MAHTTTPTYRVEMFVPGWSYTPAAWDCKRQGRPSDATLVASVRSFERSTEPGGCNAHLGATTVSRARIVRQSTGDIVATYVKGI